jgi:hypothetical protein
VRCVSDNDVNRHPTDIWPIGSARNWLQCENCNSDRRDFLLLYTLVVQRRCLLETASLVATSCATGAICQQIATICGTTSPTSCSWLTAQRLHGIFVCHAARLEIRSLVMSIKWSITPLHCYHYWLWLVIICSVATCHLYPQRLAVRGQSVWTML